MNYYKRIADGQIYAYEDNQMDWVRENNKIEELGLEPITQTEADAILNPPPTKEQRIATAVSEINAERDAELIGLVVEYNGASFDADEKSQLRMTAALTLLSAAPAGTAQSWITADNSTRELTAGDFAAIGAIIAAKVTEIMLAARLKKDAAIAEIEASGE